MSAETDAVRLMELAAVKVDDADVEEESVTLVESEDEALFVDVFERRVEL